MPSNINITELHKGEKAVIISIATNDAKYLHKLMVFNLLSGTEIELLQNFPCYVLRIGNTQLALDKKMAEHIIVSRK